MTMRSTCCDETASVVCRDCPRHPAAKMIYALELADDVLSTVVKVYGHSPLIELTRNKIADALRSGDGEVCAGKTGGIEMETGLALLKAEIETARIDSRRWYVAGYGRFWFTSKEDAEAAIGLAQAAASSERSAVAQRIRDAVDACT